MNLTEKINNLHNDLNNKRMNIDEHIGHLYGILSDTEEIDITKFMFALRSDLIEFKSIRNKIKIKEKERQELWK